MASGGCPFLSAKQPRVVKAGPAPTLVEFQKHMDYVPDGVLMIDERSIIVYVNPECAQLLGYTVDELFNQKLNAILPLVITGLSVFF